MFLLLVAIIRNLKIRFKKRKPLFRVLFYFYTMFNLVFKNGSRNVVREC